MIPIIFLALVFAIGVLWVKTFAVAGTLLDEFRRQMPTVAREVFPEEFEFSRHPKKYLFFFTKEAEQRLAPNSNLAEMRRQLIRLSTLSMVLPIALFGIAAIAILLATPRH